MNLTIFPFGAIFSKNILPILKIFQVLKSSLALLSILKVLNFEKSQISDFVFENSIGGKTRKDKSKSKIPLFSKYKTFEFERRANDDFKT